MATSTVAPTNTSEPTATNTVASPTNTSAPTATMAPAACPGDCNGDLFVRVNELVIGVNIALDRATIVECRAMDTNNNQEVSVDELVSAVNSTLSGCP